MAKGATQDPYFIAVGTAANLQLGFVLCTVGGDTSEKGEWIVEALAQEVAEPRMMVAGMRHRISGRETISKIHPTEIFGRKVMRTWLVPKDPVQSSDDVVS